MVQSNVPEEQADDTEQGWVDWYWEPLKTYFSEQSKT
jgi:hypothetical protein